MKVIIDRFEGNYAVCEKDDRTMLNIERIKLPAEAKEGDVLTIDGDHIKIDIETTNERKKRISQKMNNLWE